MTEIAYLMQEQCHRLGWTLLHFVCEGAIIALLFACVRYSLRSANARYVAGCCALATMMAAMAVTYAVHRAPDGKLPRDPTTASDVNTALRTTTPR